MRQSGTLAYRTPTEQRIGDGDYVRLLQEGKSPIGVAVIRPLNRLNVILLEGGFPQHAIPDIEGISLSEEGLEKVTKQEAIAYFHKISEGFEGAIRKGDLAGAIAARRQHYLDGVIHQFETEVSASSAVIKRPKDPMTGVYVIRGEYGIGKVEEITSEELEGLEIFPKTSRLSEKVLSILMGDLHPQKFGNIPGIYCGPGTWYGRELTGYGVFEVPEKALGLVKNPHILTIGLLR